MTTRFLEAPALAEIAARSAIDAEVRQLILACLRSTPPELVAVAEAKPADLLPVYEVRRDLWLASDGPNIIGIQRFVDALPSLPDSVAVFRVGHDEWRAIVFLDLDLTQIFAALVIDRREVQRGEICYRRATKYTKWGGPDVGNWQETGQFPCEFDGGHHELRPAPAFDAGFRTGARSSAT